MKKTNILIIGALGAAVVALVVVFLVLVPKIQNSGDASNNDAVKVEETKGVFGEPLDVTLDFYEQWRSAKVSTTSDPYKKGLATATVLSADLSKQIADNEVFYRTEQKDIIICDESMSQEVKAKEVFSNDTKAQILIYPKDKDSRGIQTIVSLSSKEGYWKIIEITCGAGEQDLNVGEFSFDYEGFLLKASAPAPLDNKLWHLVFTQEDVPGYTTPLIFKSSSKCIFENQTEKLCSDDLLFETKKVRAKGDMTEAGLEVIRLEFIK